MLKIFISYRRQDLVAAALLQSIDDRLVARFGRENVFVDFDSIPLGFDFREFIFQEVGKCDVLIALIGNQWLQLLHKRSEDPRDFVRIEIEAAIERGIPIIPLLVAGTKMPAEKQLPESIRPLAYRNGMEVDHSRDFRNHMRRLIQELEILEQLSYSQLEQFEQLNEQFQGISDSEGRIRRTNNVYDLLESYLVAHRWKEADYLTGRIMLALTHREHVGWLDADSVKNCSSSDLSLIDSLWTQHSNGHFGYSVQAEIYRELGGSDRYSRKTWEEFGKRVGWFKEESWLLYNDMTFSLDAPKGHLPDGFVAVQVEDGSVVRCWVLALASRTV